jgi:Ras GTPase-activating-like protein IQGAP2/3
MRTGRPSRKRKEITWLQAVEDPECRPNFTRSMSLRLKLVNACLIITQCVDLQQLQVLTEVFVKAIVASSRKMSYGMRFIVKETLDALRVGYCTNFFK